MSYTPMKKSVFERIERSGGNSSQSSSSNIANISHKSTHGFCSTFIKSGTCPLGDACKYIHEQPNLDKHGSKEELRITKTITRVVDMSSQSIKSTVTVSNEQRAVTNTNSTSSNRTVVESVPTSNDQSERRLSNSDRKQSQSRSSDSKRKSSSNSNESSAKKKCHSSSKTKRSADSDSPCSSTSDSEYNHSSHKRKKKSNAHGSSTKHKVSDLISPLDDEEEILHDQLLRPTQINTKSPKRTIVISERKKDENTKRTHKDTKSNPDIEFLGSKIISRDKKSIETIHQQAENNKKYVDIKRERKSPNKSSPDHLKRHSTVTITNSTIINDKNMQIKLQDGKNQSNKIQSSSEQSSDRSTQQSTPPIVQLSPASSITGTSEISEKRLITCSNEPDKIASVQPPSPICVILDDDSIPSPPVDKKVVRQSPSTPVKRSHESDKSSSKQTKRSRDSDKSRSKEKINENTNVKPKRINDDNSRKASSSRKTENENRSTSNRSESRRNANASSRDEISNRKYKEKSKSKTSRTTDSKDRNLPPSSSSSKQRNTSDHRDVARSSSEKKRSTHRRGKEKGKGLESVTDSEEHVDELIAPKQVSLEAYMSMDWSLLSRDKRIPLNTQTTSRITRLDNNINLLGVAERLLTKEQKEKLSGVEFQTSPLVHFMKQLQSKSSTQIVNSCHRRFGSCAKDMIEMRHKWFLRSVEPVQKYEFINKEHYTAYQQTINSLLDKTSTDTPTVQIETTTADVLLS